MRIKETKVYPFDELSDEGKEAAVLGLWEINVCLDWWEFTFEDAGQIGLKLTEFELDRGAYCKGEFIEGAKETATGILHNHGKDCETYKTATGFTMDSAELLVKYPVKMDDDGYDDNEYEREKEQEEVDAEFLKSVLEDYRIMLQKEYEYLTSEAAIIETIEANEYEFTEDGKLA
jgi:hypothetical protein